MSFDREVTGKEAARALLPLAAACATFFLPVTFSDVPILRYVFNPWSLLILAPAVFMLTRKWADKKFGPGDGVDDKFWM